MQTRELLKKKLLTKKEKKLNERTLQKIRKNLFVQHVMWTGGAICTAGLCSLFCCGWMELFVQQEHVR